MPLVDVVKLDGSAAGQVELADDVFGAKVNPHLLHETVRHYLNQQRAGTHKTKDKSEVSGSGRKLWKQKGTGRARVGSIRSPLWRHGGTVHGPKPRSYDYSLPKKMQVGALRSALSAKLAEEKLTVIEDWSLDSHKTKPFRQALSKLDESSRTILLVDVALETNLERASRNLEGVKLVVTTQLQPYDLMKHERLMLSRGAALKLSSALGAVKSAPPAGTVQIEGTTPAAPAKAEKKAPRAKAKKEKAAKKPAKAKAKAKPKAKKD
jgi:large subunit ribosomal protein L4